MGARKSAVGSSVHGALFTFVLEQQLPSELEFAGIPCRGHLSEVAGSKAILHVLELCVVEGIEGLCTKLESQTFAVNWERFEKGKIGVEATRTNNRILPRVAEALVHTALVLSRIPWR